MAEIHCQEAACTGELKTGKSDDNCAMEDVPERVQVMLGHIANSRDARIKNQQIGETELSFNEKVTILKEMFITKPMIFIERFHRHLEEDDLNCFASIEHEYEVNFYLKEARKRLDKNKNAVGIRNRRYEALKKLETESEYFQDVEMRIRDPLMYEHYIGQYLTQEDRNKMRKKIDKSDLRFSTILFDFMDETDVKLHCERQREEEDDMMEEEEEEDEEEELDEDDSAPDSFPAGKKKDGEEEDHFLRGVESVLYKPTPATEEEKQLLRQEFVDHMHVRFLKGQDKDFDYSKVDENDEYDSLAIRTQDEEESYFDQEEPCEVDCGSELEGKIGEDEPCEVECGSELKEKIEVGQPCEVEGGSELELNINEDEPCEVEKGTELEEKMDRVTIDEQSSIDDHIDDDIEEDVHR